jgi:hypothetical protein
MATQPASAIPAVEPSAPAPTVTIVKKKSSKKKAKKVRKRQDTMLDY